MRQGVLRRVESQWHQRETLLRRVCTRRMELARDPSVSPASRASSGVATAGLKYRQEHCSIGRIEGLVHKVEPARLPLSYASVTASFPAITEQVRRLPNR
jgi:hypothetical protein